MYNHIHDYTVHIIKISHTYISSNTIRHIYMQLPFSQSFLHQKKKKKKIKIKQKKHISSSQKLNTNKQYYITNNTKQIFQNLPFLIISKQTNTHTHTQIRKQSKRTHKNHS